MERQETLILEQEHSVMYPIDLLKVCLGCGGDKEEAGLLTTITDTNAGRQPNTSGHLHGHWQCDSNNFTSRRLHVVMARAIERGIRSWYVLCMESRRKRIDS
jgi:hypothetical protein